MTLSEELLQQISISSGLKHMIFRYFNVAGADPDGDLGEFHQPETHLIPLILDAIDGNRDDITIIGIPLSKMCNENFDGARARILMKNIAYVGAVAALLDIDLDTITELLSETFASKPHLIESNMKSQASFAPRASRERRATSFSSGRASPSTRKSRARL